MDSSISPLYNTFWERDAEKFARLYPMSLRPQAHDIIRTWAYYTILRGLYLTDETPFENIMMGGFILAPDGSPMHASKGNAVDPLEVLDEHGADALRYFAANCALGKDSPFRIQDVRRGAQVCDKLWNINQLLAKAMGGLEAAPTIEPGELRPIDRWMLLELGGTIREATAECDIFRFDQAMRTTSNFMWHDLADNYLEIVKKRIYDEGDAAVRAVLYRVGLAVLKLMAPFLPHIAEELYHQNFARLEGYDSIHTSPWPEPPEAGGEGDDGVLESGRRAVELVEALRRWKSGGGMPLNAAVQAVELPLGWKEALEPFADDIRGAMSIGTLVYKDLSTVEEKVVAVKPVHAALGPAFRKDAAAIVAHLKDADPVAVGDALAGGGNYPVPLPGGGTADIGPDHVTMERSFVAGGEELEAVTVGDAVVFVLR
jgi:valyl-tRNA synthetase